MDKVLVQSADHYAKNRMLTNHNTHGNNQRRTLIDETFCVNLYRVSIPKYRVNSNTYKFRPPKRAHLSDLSTDSVALANVSQEISSSNDYISLFLALFGGF